MSAGCFDCYLAERAAALGVDLAVGGRVGPVAAAVAADPVVAEEAARAVAAVAAVADTFVV